MLQLNKRSRYSREDVEDIYLEKNDKKVAYGGLWWPMVAVNALIVAKQLNLQTFKYNRRKCLIQLGKGTCWS